MSKELGDKFEMVEREVRLRGQNNESIIQLLVMTIEAYMELADPLIDIFTITLLRECNRRITAAIKKGDIVGFDPLIHKKREEVYKKMGQTAFAYFMEESGLSEQLRKVNKCTNSNSEKS